MHETTVADVHSDMGHLAVNAEEKQIPHLHIIGADRCQPAPLFRRRTRDTFTCIRIRVVDEPTTIKSPRIRSTILIRHADLPNRNDGCLLANTSSFNCRDTDPSGLDSTCRRHSSHLLMPASCQCHQNDTASQKPTAGEA